MPTAEPNSGAPLIADGSRRIPALDGFRGIAMILVVACHLIWPREATASLPLIDRILIRGWIGVDLFFVLSGFLITGVLLEARGSDGYFREFYRRRALRIFPIYLLLLVVYFVVLPIAMKSLGERPTYHYLHLRRFQEWYWLYGVNILQVVVPRRSWVGTEHLWSLSVEEQFYLVWPLVIWLVPVRRLAATCVGVTVTAIAARIAIVAFTTDSYAAYVLTPTRMDSLAMGALVALAVRDPRASDWLRRHHRTLIGIAGVLTVPVLALAYDSVSWPMATIGYSVTAGIAAIAIASLVVRSEAGAGGWLANPALRRAGTLSYGAYLYHLPLITLCLPIRARIMSWSAPGQILTLAGHVLWISTMFALTLLTAAVSYRLIEQPFLSLKNRKPRAERVPHVGWAAGVESV